MPYAVKFSRLAAQDLQEICDWYEAQSLGLSDKFLEVLQIMVEQIGENPYRFMEKGDSARMVLLKKFPYKIFYMVNESKRTARVIALMHRARSPKVWQGRV